MTKEQVLQKANEYCTEKAYTNETLTDEFKDKFSDFFSRKYPDANEDDEAMLADLKFNLDTAFSATSKGLTSKQKAFDEKETQYKNQIAELTKKASRNTTQEPKIPQEVVDQLNELKKFKDEEAKKSKKEEILTIAKKSVRPDLHKSFEKFADGVDVSLDKADKEQADALVQRFQEIFMDSIGDIKPLAPKVAQQRDEEFFAQLPKVKVV